MIRDFYRNSLRELSGLGYLPHYLSLPIANKVKDTLGRTPYDIAAGYLPCSSWMWLWRQEKFSRISVPRLKEFAMQSLRSCRAELALVLSLGILNVLLIEEVSKGRQGIERSPLSSGDAYYSHSNDSGGL
jgi:hypothetical protein